MPGQTSIPLPSSVRWAAQYLRMSSEHQRYSIANQAAAIALYAAAQNIGIARSFVDEGKSGTTIKGRRGLQELLRIVQSGSADFDLILVYDVSRLGRFADVDEAAHYEYLCKRAGIAVQYCAEPFENDNSTTSNLMKALKRTMAAEFSRELGVKVLAGQCRLVRDGYKVGGRAPYGLRRFLVDESRHAKQILHPGNRKNIPSDHTILVPGEDHEVLMVRRIFDLFTKDGKTTGEIVRSLNGEGLSFRGHSWAHTRVAYILENPAYMGAGAHCRLRSKGGRVERNPIDRWVVCEGAYTAIIPPDQFQTAQKIIIARREGLTKQGMLAALKQLWKENGTLSEAIIDNAKGMPTRSNFRHRFGGIVPAYQLIGFQPKRDYTYIRAGQNLKSRRSELMRAVALQIEARGGSVKPARFQTIQINDGMTARVMFCRPRVWAGRGTVWPLIIKQKRVADVLIAARLGPTAPFTIVDYYVIPKGAELRGSFHTYKGHNPAFIDRYRMETLTLVIAAFGRVPVQVTP